MNQYSHPQTGHFHLISSATNSNSLNENYPYSSYQTSFYEPSIADQSCEYYSNLNEPIYHHHHSIPSFDQSQPIYPEYAATKQVSEQLNQEQKVNLNEGQYKWMQVKRAPPKTSGIIRQVHF